MKFDAAAPTPADLTRCDRCGKPKGYKGYYGPECQCEEAARTPAPGHSIHANPPKIGAVNHLLPNRGSPG
jgi:hypothetical protein